MDFNKRINDLNKVKKSILSNAKNNLLFNTEKKIRDIDNLISINTELSKHNIIIIPGDKEAWLKVKKGSKCQ